MRRELNQDYALCNYDQAECRKNST